MGWASGSRIALKLIETMGRNVPQVEQRIPIYEDMINCLLNEDWDTVDEVLCIDPVFDHVIRKKFPDWFDEDDSVGYN